MVWGCPNLDLKSDVFPEAALVVLTNSVCIHKLAVNEATQSTDVFRLTAGSVVNALDY